MITIAVLYNVFFVIARSVFWDMTHNLWMIFDYIADVIYLMDLFVRLYMYLNLYLHQYLAGLCGVLYFRMHEAYLEQGLIVKDAKKLRTHYVKNR